MSELWSLFLRAAFVENMPLTFFLGLCTFIALSRKRTRVIVGLDMRPRTLSARLLIQSLKFAKANLYSRFEARVGRFAKDIEDQYNRSQGMRV